MARSPMKLVAAFQLVLCGALMACTNGAIDQPRRSTTSPASAGPSCPPVVESTVTGTVADPALDEISGLTVGHRMGGVLWVEEDSGNDAAVYALEPTGEVVAEVAVN